MGGVVVFDFEVLQKLTFYGTFIKKRGVLQQCCVLGGVLGKGMKVCTWGNTILDPLI